VNGSKLIEQIQHSYEEALNRGEPAQSPSSVFAAWDLYEARLAHATHLSQLGLDDDAPDSAESRIPHPDSLPHRPVRSQPAVELKGRVVDWVAEIRRLRDAGETMLFVAATPGRAERTIELLKEYDVFAVPVERADDARYAAVLVAVGALSRGFRLPDAGLQVCAEADGFEEEGRAPARQAVPGHAFSPDSHWQQQFEDAFEYELTLDQKSAIADIKRDMESSTPMDRLLCGDVGYGKTEVAMRAAFKAVMDGKQVAFLAPTTVLAFQHQKTLKERFAGFPVR